MTALHSGDLEKSLTEMLRGKSKVSQSDVQRQEIQNTSRQLGCFKQKRQKRTSRVGKELPYTKESSKGFHICLFA